MSYQSCIVIPAYNEAKRLSAEAFSVFAKNNTSSFLLFVNDGSTDDTANMIHTFSAGIENCTVISTPKNEGKANAVRAGMLHALVHIPSQYYAYFDADLSTPLSELFLLEKEMQSHPTLEFVFGSRILKMGSLISRKSYRHYLGRIIATFISLQLGLPIYDTQCGAKLFKASIAIQLFQQPFMSKWLFDVELLNRMLQLYAKKEVFEKIKEVPLTIWEDVDGSKLGFIDVLRTPIDLCKIALRYRH